MPASHQVGELNTPGCSSGVESIVTMSSLLAQISKRFRMLLFRFFIRIEVCLWDSTSATIAYHNALHVLAIISVRIFYNALLSYVGKLELCSAFGANILILFCKLF